MEMNKSYIKWLNTLTLEELDLLFIQYGDTFVIENGMITEVIDGNIRHY